MADVDIVLGTVDETLLPRIFDGVAGYFGYQDTIDGEPNPETKAQYGRRKLRRMVIGMIKKHERQAAINALVIDEVDIHD